MRSPAKVRKWLIGGIVSGSGGFQTCLDSGRWLAAPLIAVYEGAP